MQEELILEDWLTSEGLKTYRRNVENYNRLLDKKRGIISALSGLKSIKFDKDKVTNGSKNHISQQEILAMRLEDINAEIKPFEHLFLTLKPEYLKQFARIPDFDNRKILQMFYLQAQTSSICTMYLFGEQSDIKENWENYIQKFKTLKRQALKDFDKLARMPYVPVTRQKHLI